MVDFFFKGSSVFYLTTHMCVKDEENLLSTQQVFLKCLLWAKQCNSYWYTNEQTDVDPNFMELSVTWRRALLK